MERQMFRKTLGLLEASDRLLHCHEPVDPIYELGAVLDYFDSEKPIVFSKVKGHKVPVVGGIFGERQIYYDLMGMTKEDRLERIMDAIANPKPPKLLEDGPIKENIITRNIDIGRMFPIPKSNGEDSERFITAGMLVVKDPETKKTYMAVRRFQINEKDEINALISGASPLLLKHFKELEEKRQPLECALVLGYDAEYLLASQISSEKYGVDKYHVDSALRGEPLELVKCHSVDLEVPAYAEMVFEGHLIPNKRVDEGPFGELMGYYGEVAPNPVMKIQTVMHRNEPYFQHAFPSREEHLSNGLIREAEVFSYVNNLVDAKDVHITVGGGCRFHGIIQIKKNHEGDPKTAIMGALGSSKDIKHVVVVDEDIDIYNYKDVELALASRVQAGKDLVVIQGALGSGLEASHVAQGYTDKIGIDGTKPLGEQGKFFERAVIPGYENIDIGKYFPDMK
ncbi:UbiD family decarboxylase [Isachenkonia alkalipeptolytica]|uniref:UbiD family decarboxylase n=1 Tax=Isachenkonia alkalipeptolytica TaxID=2565777 RepID=A0AA43XMS3_9CLOT|nr:UbiD family decarboxylase [Isachenkonia alkalipeptolytica]NBG88805.1 UbiD family decarboxylase [Isachenkonia alkalipeptolytica]